MKNQRWPSNERTSVSLSLSLSCSPPDNDGTTTGRVICGRWCDRMQDGRQYVPIALIVIVNSSHVARGESQEFIPRRNHADGKHRSARTNSAKRPPVIHGLISSSRVLEGVGGRFNWESTFTGILITGGYISSSFRFPAHAVLRGIV